MCVCVCKQYHVVHEGVFELLNVFRAAVSEDKYSRSVADVRPHKYLLLVNEDVSVSEKF